MVNMQEIKRYQVWQLDGGSSWYYTDYDTLKEAVESVKYGEYFITEKVNYEVKQIGGQDE